eukprot:GFUD01062570.1.p1 GENE.GFUD01062570.1~~GFUD01062570.1.p1  ORF type:complete len:852 (+),score=326.90 GFUD01062570.1:43-2598(+)
MSAKIVLSSEPGSAKFSDRVLLLNCQPVKVSRSSKEEKPDTHNAIFDCRVLSKSQAVFSYQNEEFFLMDTGSSNGSFINNFRLSKPGHSSVDSLVFSQDILRFGSQVSDRNKMVKEKCIVAKIRIYLPCGTEYKERPATDKLYRPLADIQTQEKPKQVSFALQEGLIEDKVEKLETRITERLGNSQDEFQEKKIENLEKKLKRKQNESNNLMENMGKFKENEDKMSFEIRDLKQELEVKTKELEKLADELAVKAKEQIDNVRVTDLQSELQDTQKVLKRTTDEIWLLKERFRVENENGNKKDREIAKLTCAVSDLENTNKSQNMKENQNYKAIEVDLEKHMKELESQRNEIIQLNDLVSEADEIVKEKEKEISWLNDLVHKEQSEIQEREGDYLNLKCLMTEENETVHQIESEMRRLVNIIAEDQEALQIRDNQIISLQHSLREKDEFLRNECNDVCNTKHGIEEMFQKTEEEKNSEILKVRNEMKTLADTFESEIFDMKVELEGQKNIIEKKNLEIEDMAYSKDGQDDIMQGQEVLELKIEELMNIIEGKNMEIDKLQLDDKSQEVTASRNETLQKEMLVLKVSLQQKDSDIKSLNELLDRKEEIISQNNSAIEQYVEEVNLLKTQDIGKKESVENEIVEKVQNLQQKIVNEQEINKQIEDKILKLRIELDSVKQELITSKENNKDLPKSNETKLLKSKDEEIEGLKKKILQEQQIVAHVQVTQEREIIEKEKEISILNTILTQERQVLMEKEREIENLMISKFQDNDDDQHLSPAAPPRTKLSVLSPPAQSAFLTDTQSDDDSETVTFHDALSDDEDVLIEDLELDEDSYDKQKRVLLILMTSLLDKIL